MLTAAFRHCLFIILFSKENKIIIQNDYLKKGLPAYNIWKDHLSKNWIYASVKRLLKSFKDSGTMNIKEDSVQCRLVATEKSANLIKELIFSQEEALHTHLAPRKIAEEPGISRLSIRRTRKE